MVFRVTEDGVIKADTLCKFVESPSGATRLVGEKHQVRIFVTFLMHFNTIFFLTTVESLPENLRYVGKLNNRIQ